MDQGPQRGPYIRQPSILRSSLYPGSALASFARFEKKRVTSPQTLFPSMCLFRPENTWEETRVLRGDCWEKRCFQSLKDKVGNFSFVVIFGVSWKSANIPVIRIFKMISSRREEFFVSRIFSGFATKIFFIQNKNDILRFYHWSIKSLTRRPSPLANYRSKLPSLTWLAINNRRKRC